MGATILKQVESIAQSDEGDINGWIADKELRNKLLAWATENRELPPAERALPCWRGKEIKEFVYHMPCITVRKALDGKLLAELGKDWKPGVGTWIAERSVHNVLWGWLEEHQLVGVEAKEKAKKLKETPPRMPAQTGKQSPIIKRTKVARAMTDAYIQIADSYVKPGSNHHCVIFNNGKDGKERERKVVMTTMLEAAKRASMKKPVIVKTPPEKWEGEWHYEMALCVNDMVECLDPNIFEANPDNFAPEHSQTPYFRVQKISSKNEKKINLSLRHHSISGTDDDWGLWRIRSLGNLNFKQAHIGNLGLTPDNDS